MQDSANNTMHAAGPIAPPLLAWFAENRRPLPFREDPSPYHIWISEIMLQQTQVATALPYYRRFVATLPDIAALAACGEEQLLKLWEGLGYYSRVRNLQKAAQAVMAQHGGKLPADYDALLALPGIGPYTAGAIASIAFGLPCVAVDGNVLRVMARLLDYHGEVGAPQSKKLLAGAVRAAMPPDAPGPYNEALMELGALVCLPGAPRCAACPLASLCKGHRAGAAESLPVIAKKAAKVESDVCVLLITTASEAGETLLLCRRPKNGLLAGLWGPLTIEGVPKGKPEGNPSRLTKQTAQAELDRLFPGGGAKVLDALPKARHIFTHRVWRLYGWYCLAPANTAANPPKGGVFVTPAQLRQQYAIPGAFRPYLQAWLENNPK